MTEYEFTIHFVVTTASGENTVELADNLYEAGFDDSLVSTRSRGGVIDVTRDGDDFETVLFEALAQAESVSRIMVERVEVDDLVSQADIAARTAKSREAVRLWIKGDRGPGGFPMPVERSGRRSELWRWSDVAEWLGDTTATEQARIVEAVNGALALRRAGAVLDRTAFERVRRLAGV